MKKYQTMMGVCLGLSMASCSGFVVDRGKDGGGALDLVAFCKTSPIQCAEPTYDFGRDPIPIQKGGMEVLFTVSRGLYEGESISAKLMQGQASKDLQVNGSIDNYSISILKSQLAAFSEGDAKLLLTFHPMDGLEKKASEPKIFSVRITN